MEKNYNTSDFGRQLCVCVKYDFKVFKLKLHPSCHPFWDPVEFYFFL